MKSNNSSKFCILILLSLVLFVGTNEPVSASPLKKTIIAGRVTHFTNPYDLPVMKLIQYMPFIGEWNTYSCYIEQDGRFRFDIEQLYPDEILIEFNALLSIYVFPGDSIYLTVDSGIAADTAQVVDDSKYISINCPHQQFQDEYQDFMHAFSRRYMTMNDFYALRDAQTDLGYKAYTAYINERSASYDAFLKEYINSKKPDKAFSEWAGDWLYLNGLEDLLRYAWLHPMYNDLDQNTFQLPDAYYNFLADERHNDENLLSSMKYFSFLRELHMHLYHKFSNSEQQAQFRSLYDSGKKSEAYRLRLIYIIENSSGFEQQFLVSNLYSRLIYWKFIKAFDELYDPSLIGRDDYNQVLMKEYTALQELINHPVFAKDVQLHQPGSSEGDLVFSSLPEKYPDKVIYVDFWASWCGPCMGEMPHSKELQEKFTGKDVVFVFLANQCTRESWKATIAQHQLTGEQYLLSDKEYDLLSGQFNIGGIPRYMIIDKEGKVVNSDAPRPGVTSLIGLLESICEK